MRMSRPLKCRRHNIQLSSGRSEHNLLPADGHSTKITFSTNIKLPLILVLAMETRGALDM